MDSIYKRRACKQNRNRSKSNQQMKCWGQPTAAFLFILKRLKEFISYCESCFRLHVGSRADDITLGGPLRFQTNSPTTTKVNQQQRRRGRLNIGRPSLLWTTLTTSTYQLYLPSCPKQKKLPLVFQSSLIHSNMQWNSNFVEFIPIWPCTKQR